MGNPKGFLDVDRENARVRDPKERIGDFKEHEIPAGEGRVRNQASRCMDCGVPFCMSGCPLGNYIPDWNDLIYKGHWEEAIRGLHATNNFPEFTGLVCPAPCESACVLGITHPPVTIKQIESSIVGKAFNEGWVEADPPSSRTGKTVAVIGSGPAGLSCAQQLNRAGHTVTIFERQASPGGLLLYGIPNYKLSRQIVERRVALLREEGINFKTNCAVGTDITFAELHQRYDATVLCLGAEKPRDLMIPGRDADGIHFAMEFLAQQARRDLGEAHPDRQANLLAKDKSVIVIGGGDTGSDCMGTSLRHGASLVTNFELMGQPPSERIPSNPWPQDANVYKVSSSVEEVLATGGSVEYQVMTKRFISDKDNKVTGLETVQVEWTPDSKTGKSVMREVEDSLRIWQADLVLLAMGYMSPLTSDLIQEFDIKLDFRGNLRTDERTKMTSVNGLFAAGDCRRGQSLVVWAIAEGRDTAACVDAWLMQRESCLPRLRTTRYNY